MSYKNKLLWVIPKWTLPATDGARVATDQLVKHISQLNCEIDILCLGHPDDIVDYDLMHQNWKIRSIYFIKRQLAYTKIGKIFFYLKSIITHPFLPLTMSSFKSNKIDKLIQNILDKNEYDFLVFDGLHLATPFFKKAKLVKPSRVKSILYRAHNIEQDLWKKAAIETKNPIKRLLLFYQYKVIKKFEKEVVEKSQLVIPISYEDEKRIKTIVKNVNTHTALMGMDFKQNKIIKEDLDKINILFLGRLDWPPNKDGLIWFLEHIWPSIDPQRFKLHIAGSGNKNWLKKYQNLRGVEIHGFVKDLNKLYQLCHFSIIPIFYGSGTRIKVIESYAHMTPIVSTKMGAQGSTLKANIHYAHAENKHEWIDKINSYELKTFNHFAKLGHEYLKDEFDARHVAKNLFQRL